MGFITLPTEEQKFIANETLTTRIPTISWYVAINWTKLYKAIQIIAI